MKQLKKSHFWVTAKNMGMIWGFLVAFIVFDLAIDYFAYTDNPLFVILAAALLAVTFILAHKMRKRLDAYDLIIKPTLDREATK